MFLFPFPVGSYCDVCLLLVFCVQSAEWSPRLLVLPLAPKMMTNCL